MSTPQTNPTPKPAKEKRQKPKKNGRPAKADGEKKKAHSIYFTDAERARILEQCKAAGDMPLSVFVHHQAVHGKVVEPLSKEIAQSLRAMVGIGNNINQFAKYANEHRTVQPIINQLIYEGKLLSEILIALAELCSQS